MAEPFPSAPISNEPRTAPAAAGGDPLGTARGDIGGERHYKGPTLGQVTMWTCPACGADNQGPIDGGCPTCGSGSARPYHIEPEPPRHTMQGERPPAQTQMIDFAFDTWVHAHAEGAPPNLRKILFAAWQGGIQWYQGMLAGEPGGGARLAMDPAPGGPMVSVPQRLIEQVISTLEQTFDLPEDQQSPELLALLAQLKELVQ